MNDETASTPAMLSKHEKKIVFGSIQVHQIQDKYIWENSDVLDQYIVKLIRLKLIDKYVISKW